MPDYNDPDLPAMVSKEQRNWATLAHLSCLLAFISGIGGIIAPLILWQLRKNDMSFAAAQALEALNFQITVFILALICYVLKIIFIGFLLLAILLVVDIVLIVIAATKVSEGIAYRYPFNFRLIS